MSGIATDVYQTVSVGDEAVVEVGDFGIVHLTRPDGSPIAAVFASPGKLAEIGSAFTLAAARVQQREAFASYEPVDVTA